MRLVVFPKDVRASERRPRRRSWSDEPASARFHAFVDDFVDRRPRPLLPSPRPRPQAS
jgi:hypothetical protein